MLFRSIGGSVLRAKERGGDLEAALEEGLEVSAFGRMGKGICRILTLTTGLADKPIDCTVAPMTISIMTRDENGSEGKDNCGDGDGEDRLGRHEGHLLSF